ncbi:uncharacterized protein BDZ99DRAFT_386492 [Mytilinidion resinicola]|uniref:Gfd2/YDR514C-like C-terminal domain-containing protein n=1 Tax=Mytilinidion resinicola TaxID=574789 RepID=A0A6A6YPN5_9PEZI|nr:uncharacterized protein BDZ99DRAFT_386492 [Mytilinidion resinicola]KAF2810842.1 hypothetical protein BDZ99DRAFT_386492 [Mytilinidion resinicola]
MDQISSQADALRYAIQSESSDFIINSIDVEWHTKMPREMIEIGLAVLDSRDIRGIEPGWNAENWMRKVYFYHFRIKEHGHLPNTFAHSEGFDWGTMVWLSKAEAKKALIQCFSWPVEDNESTDLSDGKELKLRPVLFLGHAVENNTAELKKALDLDLEAIGTIVKSVGTQVIAKLKGIRPRGRRVIGLKDLCYEHGISIQVLHNAGNDIAYTMFCALLMAAQEDKIFITPARRQEMEKFTDEVKAAGRALDPPSWGMTKFCARYNRDGHLEKGCRDRVRCKKCEAAGERKAKIFSHDTDRCKSQYYQRLIPQEN